MLAKMSGVGRMPLVPAFVYLLIHFVVRTYGNDFGEYSGVSKSKKLLITMLQLYLKNYDFFEYVKFGAIP